MPTARTPDTPVSGPSPGPSTDSTIVNSLITEADALAPTVVCLGASFDPPHFAHAALALLAAERHPGALIWLLPSLPRWDKSPIADFETRLSWCGEFAADLSKIGIPCRASRAEAEFTRSNGGTFRGTASFLSHLRRAAPRTRFVFLCGADSLASLPTWRDPVTGILNGLDILCHHTILVAPRGEAVPPTRAPEAWFAHCAVEFLPPPRVKTGSFARHGLARDLGGLSSSALRADFATGAAPTGFVFPLLENRITVSRVY